MIPRVAKPGRSFKGAALYYLHDKGAMTDERVAFVETANLPTDNATMAVAHMIDTATHADDLKRASGIKGGRPLQTPVYSYSLAWHTSENPTQEEQLAAAKTTLQRLGLDSRQAIIIGHQDTDHKHVHVLVNRICPETGRAANMGNDRLVLSDWALEYRRDRGEEHFCPQRSENHRRRKGEYVKDRSPSREEWTAWKKSQAKELWDQFRADKAKAKPARKAQYDALWRQKEARIEQRRAEIKAFFKPHWGDLFKRQRNDLKSFDAGFIDRLEFALSRRGRSKVMGVLQALMADSTLRVEFVHRQELERKQLGDRHKNTIADAAREVNKAWKYDRAALIEMHNQQDQQAYDDTKAKSQAIFQDKTLSPSRQDFEESKDRRKAENQELRADIDAMSDGQKAHLEDMRKLQKEDEERKRTRKKRTRKRDRGGREMDF